MRFYGMDVVEVEPGTIITHGDKELTVTETEAVLLGHLIYVTAKNMDLDLAKFPVVIVDDNATNRRILTEILQSWNMKVTATADGPSAIEAIREILKLEKAATDLLRLRW